MEPGLSFLCLSEFLSPNFLSPYSVLLLPKFLSKFVSPVSSLNWESDLPENLPEPRSEDLLWPPYPRLKPVFSERGANCFPATRFGRSSMTLTSPSQLSSNVFSFCIGISKTKPCECKRGWGISQFLRIKIMEIYLVISTDPDVENRCPRHHFSH